MPEGGTSKQQNKLQEEPNLASTRPAHRARGTAPQTADGQHGATSHLGCLGLSGICWGRIQG